MQRWGIHTILRALHGSVQQHLSKIVGSAAVALILSILTVAQASAAPMLESLSQTDRLPIGSLAVALLIAAVVVERAIELGWNYLEWILIRFFRWRPGDLKTPSYVQFKSGTSLLAGLALGILIANYGGVRLLVYLTPFVPTLLGNVPINWDIILSGIVIGAGTKPIHDILGLITHVRNLTASLALKKREEAGAALADGILKLHQANASYSIDVPGVGATRLGVRARQNEDGGSAVGQEERMERYAEILHDNLYMGS
ncbi:MAG: hypothetical protein KF893_20820 [Caldilineaceae bacterium]|nr:hypothetical protein [Caldilineaceae bacterium]